MSCTARRLARSGGRSLDRSQRNAAPGGRRLHEYGDCAQHLRAGPLQLPHAQRRQCELRSGWSHRGARLSRLYRHDRGSARNCGGVSERACVYRGEAQLRQQSGCGHTRLDRNGVSSHSAARPVDGGHGLRRQRGLRRDRHRTGDELGAGRCDRAVPVRWADECPSCLDRIGGAGSAPSGGRLSELVSGEHLRAEPDRDRTRADQGRRPPRRSRTCGSMLSHRS